MGNAHFGTEIYAQVHATDTVLMEHWRQRDRHIVFVCVFLEEKDVCFRQRKRERKRGRKKGLIIYKAGTHICISTPLCCILKLLLEY